ncbi:PDC sensor domain-containing protein [Kineococcus esterisolvens]|uniref:PDC sensor domain-containing protein n=1 Tax=unclassified Kineococcus TaxID=2621656 RepID=UPI003D7F0B63
MRAALEAHPEFTGASTAREPQAFDGEDARFAGTAGTDASGRSTPSWSRSGDEVELSALADHADESVADCCFTPKETRHPLLTEPHVHPTSGGDVLMTTATAPVLSSGRFPGVVTVDLGLTALTGSPAGIRPHGTGYASLVTDRGTVVTHPRADLLDTTLGGALGTAALDASRTGEQVNDRLEADDVIDGPALRDSTVLLGLGAFGAAGAATRVIGTRLMRPIVRLRSSLADIAGTMGGVARIADGTNTGAEQTDASVRQVADAAQRVRHPVGRFRV